MKKHDNFYISIGNTRTTFAIFDGSIDKMKMIKKNTIEIFEKMDFKEILDVFNIIPQKIFVCSVVDYASEKIKEFFDKNEIIFLNYSNQKNIDLSLLDNPFEIGNDIIASAIYAQSLAKNITIISLGTATVISNIRGQAIVGCIIAPGLEISYNALIEKTTIPKLKLNYTSKIIGKNTSDALNIGVVSGHKLMIQELTKSFHTPDTLYIYFGGNAHYIKFSNWKYVSDIDLLGLYLFSINR